MRSKGLSSRAHYKVLYMSAPDWSHSACHNFLLFWATCGLLGLPNSFIRTHFARVGKDTEHIEISDWNLGQKIWPDTQDI
ncbi:hypothetical protein M378DRAFT_1010169 [Amanita muscaria Koide BX008]|uniref:Uncharacterized protein n=1 Tax=Amanita muscaria (strain Koide BX008) TaxID=946122 RepID=A0A0C2SZ29_AMAMK|nr:hypothetical protein M378DRAFT_1010169 [Amanita muscaria Koide BX008]